MLPFQAHIESGRHRIVTPNRVASEMGRSSLLIPQRNRRPTSTIAAIGITNPISSTMASSIGKFA